MIPRGLQRVGPISWARIMREWRRNEGSQPKWIAYARRQGYPDWQSWRQAAIVQPFRCQSRRWMLYRLERPAQAVLSWYGGPFPVWRKRWYKGKYSVTFRTMARRRLNAGRRLRFPSPTLLVGIEYRRHVYIIDGMHRCLALAAAGRRGQDISAEVRIALCRSSRRPPTPRVS